MSFAKNIGRNISKNLSSKCCQKHLDHAKHVATDAIKTSSKRFTRKTAEATNDLIGNKFADKITRVSKTSLQNNYETNEEILREKYSDQKLTFNFFWKCSLINCSKLHPIFLHQSNVVSAVCGTIISREALYFDQL